MHHIIGYLAEGEGWRYDLGSSVTNSILVNQWRYHHCMVDMPQENMQSKCAAESTNGKVFQYPVGTISMVIWACSVLFGGNKLMKYL